MNAFHELLPEMVGSLLDAMPSPTFLVDEDVTIVCLNKSSRDLLARESGGVLHRRAGEVMHCIHAQTTPEGCGRARHCRDCLIRNAVGRALREDVVVRERAKLELRSENGVRKVHMAIIASPFNHGGRRYAILQLEDISELVQLRKIVPICSVCKKVRNDAEYWEQLESYFRDSLDIDFSHGICPDCVRIHYADCFI
jgi:PAS domain-containing protein